ncbi:hypothetical protein [Hymenobacter mucosus]|uniref:Uncharacterized protein n=1 Tax=Hymenobacter mucosus TaxID=1411120 RepID=A0A238XS33_9BACT|nr:hypothetical protein [Hymenobacter mucosus]SNR60829.1 hypothetical protein SAMN06269173_104280 [Hymenobacter mucosus]
MNFKLVFPGGYYIPTEDDFADLPGYDGNPSITDHNLDVYVLFEDGRVYVGTAFTVANVAQLLAKDGFYFWASDMFIVKDLAQQTIRDAVQKAIADSCFSAIFSFIGFAAAIFPDFVSYELIE